ncbi:MAG: hypothetical protein EAZ95_19390 [Bacteroidetes bacterium]|nr:MAG: hypothetical protein EAZ95_19390 [Bacteroidota bacterium]
MIIFSRFLFVLGCIVLVGCSKVPSMRCIPHDVFYASRANVLRATYQIPEWKDVLKRELDIDLSQDTTKNPLFLASGKAFLFGNILQGEQNYTALSILLLSKRNLEKFLKSVNPNLVIESFKDYNFTLRNRSMLAWNKKHLLYINSPHAANENQLRELFRRLTTLKDSEMLIKSKNNFVKAVKNDQDLSMWLNIAKMGDAPKLKEWIDDMHLQDNYMHLRANFDDGEVSVATEYFTNSKLFQDYKTLLSGSVNKTLIENLPIQKPAMVVGIGVKPEGIAQFLKDIKFTQKATNLMNSITLTFDDFVKMYSGDMVIALKDVKSLEHLLPPDSLREIRHTSDMVLGIGIKNKVIYDSLKSKLMQTGILEKKPDHLVFFGEVYVMERDSMVYFTKNELVKEDFIKMVKFDNPKLLESVSDNWFFLHADEKIGEKALEGKSLFKEATRNLLKKEELKLESATIQIANKRQNDKSKADAILLLKDKNANSLMAMLEVVREIVFQTKMRLDPNNPRNNPAKQN